MVSESTERERGGWWLLDRRGVLRGAAGALSAAVIGGRGTQAQSTQIEPSDRSNQPAVAPPGGRYFAATGHNLDDPFLGRWELAGGEAVLGAPISEDRYAEGVGVVQSFETVTLVFDPGLTPPWDVQSQHLPDSFVNALAPASARKQVTGCRGSGFCQFFPETGHTVSGRIGSFWSVSGDLPIFGMPVSEPFLERGTGLTIQVFERAVLEDHGPNDVRVRRVAVALAEDAGLTSDPAFVPAPPTAGTTWLVHSSDGLRLRGGPGVDHEIIQVLADNAEFIAAPDQTGDWVGGYADGYSGWVSKQFLTTPPPAPQLSLADWNLDVWQGIALGETNVRSQPTTKAAIASVLEYGDAVTVPDWVEGEEVFTGADIWAQVGDNAYIYGRNVGRNAPVAPTPIPDDAPAFGKWIDVNLTQQLMVAYEDRNPVHTCLMTSGVPGWATPTGTYQILVRVANETMTSGAIGAEHFYKLEDVLYTQYFTDLGHAIHYAWWRTPETIGRPGSHGCLNLLMDDSRFYWNWAEIGTVVFIHN